MSSEPRHALDIFSESFDATAALEAPITAIEAQLPSKRDLHYFRKSAPLNNIAACSSIENAPFRPLVYNPKTAVAQSSTSSGGPRSDQLPAPIVNVEGLRQGIPRVAGRRRSTRPDYADARLRNSSKHSALREFLVRCVESAPPLAFLFDCCEQRSEVSIILRRSHSIRGSVRGILYAFDKHYNCMVLNATILDNGRPPESVAQLFIRGDNVVAIVR